jgi:predicted acetyltransferase
LVALQLRELTAADESAFMEAYRAFQDPHFVFALEYDPLQSFEHYLAKLAKLKRGVEMPADRVPATLLFGFVDGAVVGRVSFRHTLNDWLFRNAGHLGYGVVPQFRRNGYATEMLRQALPWAWRLGLPKLLLTPTNEPSRKVIAACGGRPEPGDAGRYWIHRDGAL